MWTSAGHIKAKKSRKKRQKSEGKANVEEFLPIYFVLGGRGHRKI